MKYWLINAICGVLLLVMLGMHMATMHLDDVLILLIGNDDNPLGWPQVVERGKNNIVTAGYIVFLGTALFHGLYGLHTILTELWSGQRAERLIRYACWSAGLLLFLTGTIVTVSFGLLSQSP